MCPRKRAAGKGGLPGLAFPKGAEVIANALRPFLRNQTTSGTALFLREKGIYRVCDLTDRIEILVWGQLQLLSDSLFCGRLSLKKKSVCTNILTLQFPHLGPILSTGRCFT